VAVYADKCPEVNGLRLYRESQRHADRAVVVPPSGGETEFADCRAAYDALPDMLHAEAKDRFAEHWVHHSRSTLGWEPTEEETRGAMPLVRCPLVRVHPGSGRKTLYIGAHARRVMGMALPAGHILLRDLMEHATRPQFVYRHAWRAGDLVLWDNRSVMHRGCRYDLGQIRDMRRTTVLDPASVDERDWEDDSAESGGTMSSSERRSLRSPSQIASAAATAISMQANK
jgi:alpha-ketoglutarate-dependent taurine dioxygenase